PLIEKLISELVNRGMDVGSVKHHTHKGFEIDYPGKDSYRHRAAGASETVIAAPGLMARIKTIDGEVEARDIVDTMPGHDIVIVEGYRKSGLPTIEVMRAANEADSAVAEAFVRGARQGLALDSDFTQISRGLEDHSRDISEKMPTSETVAIATDIPAAVEAAAIYGIPAFGIDDIKGIADFLQENYTRKHVTVVIQAGGESRRMGRSKATIPFAGRPLLCRIIERVSPVADELLITTNEPNNLSFLDDYFPDMHIRLVRDEYDFRGALPGIYTALNAAANPYVAIVACDMVNASGALIVAESLEMTKTHADIVVPSVNGLYEPFHATYRKDSCTDAVLRAISEGESRAQVLLEDPRLNVVDFLEEDILSVEPLGECFINANTPEELDRLEKSVIHEWLKRKEDA
ncbi:MAG: molybdopterin-guanine dinucleotide biosynthesis protein B, partial [Eggerthellaceae bacterium]|nr:molybdopterin-guanine dinucleotide biosynthesis protein B [Eggerthellaceae bacterium]